jgi:hypothetical protein
MDLLISLAEQTSIRLEQYLIDFDDADQQRDDFHQATRLFFDEQFSRFEERRKELETNLRILSIEVQHLCDELGLSPLHIDEHGTKTIKEKEKFFQQQLIHLKGLIYERDKELIQLKQSIEVKVSLIGIDNIVLEKVCSIFDQWIFFFFSSIESRIRFSRQK